MIGVGIIGLGTVGSGTYKILTESQSLIKQKTGLDIQVVKIAETDPAKARGKRLPAGTLTRDAHELIRDKNVRIVVELMGGIHPAHEFITEALREGKWVVTANKALLAEKGNDLFGLQKKRGAKSDLKRPYAEASPLSGPYATALWQTGSPLFSVFSTAPATISLRK